MRVRSPIFFPNFFMKLMPLSAEAKEAVANGRIPKELRFRVPPNIGKVEIRNYLESIYGVNVKKVSTINVEGKKKTQRTRTKVHYYRLPDYKKAIVELDEGVKS